MQFNTYLFVLLFLPVTVGLYYLVGKRSHKGAPDSAPCGLSRIQGHGCLFRAGCL